MIEGKEPEQVAEKVRQRSGRLRLRSRLRKKESDLRSTLTSTSAYIRICGLAWDKARPRVKSLSWQTQGGRVK
jgi:hypothetical protein